MFAALKSGGSLPPTALSQKPAFQQESQNNDIGDRGGKRNPQVKVFNIPEETEQNDLETFFASVGNVKYVKILPVRDGKTTSLGFVEFETDAECEAAVQQKNNQDFNGQSLRVMLNVRDGEQRGGGGSGYNSAPRMNGGGGGRPQVKVFNIPDGTTDDEIRKHFASAGQVSNVKILPCREGKDTTLGFVHFENSEDVQKAVTQFHETDFKGSQLRVVDGDQNNNNAMSFTQSSNGVNSGGEQRRTMGRGAQLLLNISQMNQSPRSDSRPQAKVFGIPQGSTQEEVSEHFSSAGTVKFVKLLPIREGKDNHLGFVEFECEDEVDKAVEILDGSTFRDSQLKVMRGSNQPPNMGSGASSGGWNARGASSAPMNRIPREERQPFADRNGVTDMAPADFSDNACRRCGEIGHFARECVNAPMDGGMLPQAVTYIPPPPPDTEQEIFEAGVNQGLNFEKYTNIPVKMTGKDVPKFIESFDEADLHPTCLKNIKLAKYIKPTPVQKLALPAILARRDVMACAQTGSGKTASFLLPVITNLLKDGLPAAEYIDGPVLPQALVLSPTRELAMQIFTEARKFSYNSPIKPVVIYGGVNVSHQTERLRMGCHLLVATPGRLDDFVKRGKVSFRNLKFFILDEADRMVDMGFGQQLKEIIDNSEMPPKGLRNTLMFSATFPPEIQQLAEQYLSEHLFLSVGMVGGACADVQQSMLQVPGSKKRETLETILKVSGTNRTLVFVERKRDADFLASFLSQRKYPATSLNADRSQEERECALRDFRNGVAPVLVATAVAARGLDINDVKHVINYDLPSDATEYVHRIGRTGRIGNKGKSTSFFDMERDSKLTRGLVKILADAEQDIPDWLESAALAAVGTGYGPDGGQFRDRRERFGGGGQQNGQFNAGRSSGQMQAAVVDDDEEEW